MGDLEADLRFDPERVCETIGRFLEETLEKLKGDGFILGLSGGVDSAAVAALISKTVGPDTLLGLFLPDRDSDPRSERDGRAVAKRFGFEARKTKISPALKKLGIYDIFWPIYYMPRWLKERIYKWEHIRRNPQPGKAFLETRLGTKDRDLRRFNAFSRAKVRMRMLALYMNADLENRLVVGTTNYSEFIIGWCARWGDTAADVSPVVELYKTQIWELAKYLEVPDEIVTKRPSPDLVAGMYDEDGIGLTYRKLDMILAGINRGMSDDEIALKAGIATERVGFIHELIRRTDHMRDMPAFPKLGIGSRIYSAAEIQRRPPEQEREAE